MTKKVPIGTRPTTKQSALPAADTWVEHRSDPEPMKRLTLDIPATLHRAIKTQCAAHGTTIVEELRALLAEKYGDQ